MLKRFSFFDPVDGVSVATYRCTGRQAAALADDLGCDYEESRYGLRDLTDQTPRETLHGMLAAITDRVYPPQV